MAMAPQMIWVVSPDEIGTLDDDFEDERDAQCQQAGDERAQGAEREARQDGAGEGKQSCERFPSGQLRPLRFSGGCHDPCGDEVERMPRRAAGVPAATQGVTERAVPWWERSVKRRYAEWRRSSYPASGSAGPKTDVRPRTMTAALASMAA